MSNTIILRRERIAERGMCCRSGIVLVHQTSLIHSMRRLALRNVFFFFTWYAISLRVIALNNMDYAIFCLNIFILLSYYFSLLYSSEIYFCTTSDQFSISFYNGFVVRSGPSVHSNFLLMVMMCARVSCRNYQ